MSQPGCQSDSQSAADSNSDLPAEVRGTEKQITRGPGGRILTNTGVWSPDGEWLVYDTRNEAAGGDFNGSTIEMVNVNTGEVRTLYRSRDGANCGVATFHPRDWKVIFILGPENPTPDWQYGFSHRQGVIVEAPLTPPLSPSDGERVSEGRVRGIVHNLDARDLTPPFTPGALRGGSHVHVWDAAGEWVSFTYNDALVESDIRDVGVSIPRYPVQVSKDHSRNHDGEYFSVLVTRTTPNPKPGSDEIKRACEEGWVATNGYLRRDGTRQKRALAFQGHVLTSNGQTNVEVFIADLPEDLTQPSDWPLAGTETRRPCPPKGVVQRRLTFTAERTFPGIQGPRHWLRSSFDGSRIAFLMKDDDGVVQLWTVSPNGGDPKQLTRNRWPIASTFTWSPDGRWIAHVMDGSVCRTDSTSGRTQQLTARSDDSNAPRPEACVFSPDGKKIAFVRRVGSGSEAFNQICVVWLEK